MTGPVPARRDRRPDRVRTLFDEAAAAQRRGGLEAAIAGYSRVLAIAPDHASAWNNLGVALRKARRFDAAIACYVRVLERDPANAGALGNLGNALKDAGRFDEAAAALRRAVALDPEDASALYNLGLALKAAGRLDEALDVFEKAQACDPGSSDIRFDIALARLAGGDLEGGWPAYEARWGLDRAPAPRFADRRWDGKAIEGTLLVTTEQGYGDIIQFVRYARPARERCARLVLECREGIESLVVTAGGVDEVVTRGAPLPPFEAAVPLLSLPGLYGTTLETIPGKGVPYLVPSARARARRAAPPDGRFTIGIAWAGSPTHRNDRNRSFGFERFLALCRVPGVALVSLQKGAAAGDPERSGCRALVAEPDPPIGDFDDTAAIVAQLDLVVSCDSAVAHLAGALGKPVWTLLPFAPDWRWMTGRADTPWYPTMRLFRQQRPGDWDGVFERVTDELRGGQLQGAASQPARALRDGRSPPRKAPGAAMNHPHEGSGNGLPDRSDQDVRKSGSASCNVFE